MYIATRILSKTCFFVLSHDCHFRLKFWDVNARKLKFWEIQYIVYLSLNSWMSLFVTTKISSSSSLNDLAFLVSLSLKTFKTTPVVMVSSLCTALYLWPFLSLEWRRLKLFVNYSIRFSIAVVILSSLSLSDLSTSLFWRLSGEVTSFLVK